MTKPLSKKSTIQFSRWAKLRDGDIGLYCGKPLGKHYVLEHLNDNRLDNRLENFINEHQSCNIAKAHNTDYSLIAHEKLKQNELAPFVPPIEDEELDEISTEIKISKNNFDIIEQHISEKIVVDGKINWDDALYGGVYKCKKLTGYGSTQCTRSYLKTLTCSEAPFMVTKDENKKKIIVKRTGN